MFIYDHKMAAEDRKKNKKTIMTCLEDCPVYPKVLTVRNSYAPIFDRHIFSAEFSLYHLVDFWWVFNWPPLESIGFKPTKYILTQTLFHFATLSLLRQ